MHRIKLPLAIGFGILSSYLLRDSFIGLNWAIFFIVLVLLHFVFKRNAVHRFKFLKLLIFIMSSCALLIYGEDGALALTLITFLALVADSSPRVTAFFNDILTTFSQMFRGLPQYFSSSFGMSKHKITRNFSLVLIPFGLLLVFFSFYSSGSQFFGDAVSSVAMNVNEFFRTVFGVMDFQGWVLFAFGIVFLGGAVHTVNPGLVTNFLDKVPLALQRKKDSLKTGKSWINKSLLNLTLLSLKREHKIALLVLVSLNTLLFFVNLFDLIYLWFDMEPSAVSYSRFVREGTSHLIFTIILAAGVVLFYFRGNLNFYSKTSFLRKLAYVWIAQNIILALNVGLRNMHYIEHTHALTNKRIGVFIFLLIVIMGLISLYAKVHYKKTIAWLAKINAFGVIALLAVVQLVNTERIMISYNFSNPSPSKIDMRQIFREVQYDLVYLEKMIKTTDGLRVAFRESHDVYAYWNRKKARYKEKYEETKIRCWTWHKHQNLKLPYEETEYFDEYH